MSSSCKLMYTCYSLDYIIDISYHTPNKVNLVKLPTWAYHVYHIDPSLLGASIFPSSLRSNWKNRLFFHHFWWDWLIDLDFFTIRNHEKIPMVSHVSRWNRHVPPVFHASNPSLGCPCAIHGVKDDSKLGARGVKAVRVDDDLNDADLDFLLWFTLW